MQPLTIQLVTWNSAAALRTSLPYLQKIDPLRVVVRVIDNASKDESLRLVALHLPNADIISLPRNTGFAGGHNVGFQKCTTRFVLVLNPDVRLAWDGIDEALTYFTNEKVGAIQGKLYRNENKIFDSAGIVLTRALNGRERGSGEVDRGQYEETASLHAITGACGLYRVKALRECAHEDNEVFDQDFFAYKEDVDLGWRLKRAGWKIIYAPHVVGFHARSLKQEGYFGWNLSLSGLRARVRDSRTRYSIRNWFWMIVKNAMMVELLLCAPWLLARSLIFLITTLVYWPLFSVWIEMFRGAPRMIAKRRSYS